MSAAGNLVVQGTSTGFGQANLSAPSGSQLINVGGGFRALAGTGSNSRVDVAAGVDQTINAQYLEVVGQPNSLAFVAGGSGTQMIHTTGQNASNIGLLVNSAQVETAGAQTITVDNADHARVIAQGGLAGIQAVGSQTILVQGAASLNSLEVSAAGSAFPSQISGANQSITAGSSGQAGGITITGGAGDSQLAGIRNTGGNQSVSTTGTISISGGSSAGPSGAPASINNNFGLQTITANAIQLQAGNSGTNNSAAIDSDLGQVITVGAGGISITGGTGGQQNDATISQSGNASNQTITVNGGSVAIQAGGGAGNIAGIAQEGAGGAQTITTNNLSLAGGSGADAIGFVTTMGPSIGVTYNGAVQVSGGSGAGALALLGSRNTDVSVTLTGAAGSGAVTLTGGTGGVGSFGYPAHALIGAADANANVTINSQAGITLNRGGGGAGLGDALIGSATLGGTVILKAGLGGAGNLALNDGIVLTSGNATLQAAAGQITQSTGSVLVGGTTTLVGGSASLASGSNNFVGAVNFTGSNLSISDANALTLGAVNASNLTVNAGSIGQNSSGIVVSGTTTLSASSITLNSGANDFGTVVVSSPGNVSLTDTNAISIGASSVGGTFDVFAPSTSFLNGFSANNYTFSGGTYSLAAGTYNLGGTTTVAGPATVTASGATINAAGGTINVAGVLDSGTSSLTAGTLNILAGGTLKGTGTIVGNVNNSAGTVAPGASPGILTITGNYVQGPSGTLDMQIGGLIAGSDYDQLVVSGNASLGGTLNSSLINSFIPPAGSTFTLVQASGGLSGTFNTINQPAGTLFNNFYGPTTFEFIAAGGGGTVPAPIAPTFNYTIVSTEQLSQPLIELIETIVVSVVEPATTITPEGTLVPKPPACN